jgi:hypothetical protein
MGRTGSTIKVDGHQVQASTAAAVLEMDYSSRELRDMASELDVTRSRGDTKLKTAERIVSQAPERLRYKKLDSGDGFRLVPDLADDRW